MEPRQSNGTWLGTIYNRLRNYIQKLSGNMGDPDTNRNSSQ